MKELVFLMALIWALPAAATAPSQRNCQLDVPCKLGDRSYHVKEPDGWDGITPLPLMIHFHGWQRTGALPVQHQRISGATRRRGVLLVAPNGRNKTWNMWSPETEDVQFAADVLEDVSQHYPIDTDNIFVSGYSYGSVMAWRVACDRGKQMNIRALLAVSGTLGRTEACAEAPREVRYVHGLGDNVLPFPFGPDGDLTNPVKLWRDELGCADPPAPPTEWSVVDFLSFKRTTWTGCTDGVGVTFDVHPGGHFIPHGWFGRQLDELLGRTPTYP